MTSTTTQRGAKKERTFLGQPWGLANLFGVEMWERFSFYGMQAILAYYIYFKVTEGGLGQEKSAALSIVGAYGGFVYMMALTASFVADRILGPERTLFYSAIVVMSGHIVLAFIPGMGGLALGLVLIGLGSGGVKTAAQVVLGQLYDRQDPKRDAGFSIFYLGVNIGALFGPALVGVVRESSGFHWGFGLAAIGMAFGLAQYAAMRRTTIAAAGREVPNPLPRSKYPALIVGTLVLVVVVVAVIAGGLIPLKYLSTITAGIALVAAVVLITQMCTSPLTTAVEKSRLIGFIPMLVGCVLFFALFQSQFTVLAVYAESHLNRHILGFEIPAASVQSINPVFIIIFSLVFAGIWTKLGDRQWSTPMKFGIANIIIGLSMFVFLPFAGGGENSTPFLVIVLILFLFTMGELLLSPVGNSLATKVAPEAFQSRTFAVWLMAISMGSSLAGTLGTMWDPSTKSSESAFYISVGVAAILLGAVLLALRPWILRKFVDVR